MTYQAATQKLIDHQAPRGDSAANGDRGRGRHYGSLRSSRFRTVDLKKTAVRHHRRSRGGPYHPRWLIRPGTRHPQLKTADTTDRAALSATKALLVG
jgi:hypothetical protein